MNKHLKNITPLFVLTVVGLIFCLGEIAILLGSSDKGELATGLLSILALVLFLLFFIDRFLIRKLSFQKVVVGEIIFILIVPLFYLYLNKRTNIIVDTSKQYFVLLYDKNGLDKKQIPSSGIFNHSITFKNSSIINLNYTLTQ